MGKKNRKAKSISSEVKEVKKEAKKVTAGGDKITNSKGLNKKKRSKGLEPKERSSFFLTAILVGVTSVAAFLIIQNYTSLSETSVRPLYRILANHEDLDLTSKELDISVENKDVISDAKDDTSESSATESASCAENVKEFQVDIDYEFPSANVAKFPESNSEKFNIPVEIQEPSNEREVEISKSQFTDTLNEIETDRGLAPESLTLKESEVMSFEEKEEVPLEKTNSASPSHWQENELCVDELSTEKKAGSRNEFEKEEKARKEEDDEGEKEEREVQRELDNSSVDENEDEASPSLFSSEKIEEYECIVRDEETSSKQLVNSETGREYAKLKIRDEESLKGEDDKKFLFESLVETMADNNENYRDEEIPSDQPISSKDGQKEDEMSTLDHKSTEAKESEKPISQFHSEETAEDGEHHQNFGDSIDETNQIEEFSDNHEVGKMDDGNDSASIDRENTVEDYDKEEDEENDELIQNGDTEIKEVDVAKNENLRSTEISSETENEVEIHPEMTDLEETNADVSHADSVVENQEEDCLISEEECSKQKINDNAMDEEDEDEEQEDEDEENEDEGEDEAEEKIDSQESDAVGSSSEDRSTESSDQQYGSDPEVLTEQGDDGFVDITNGVKKRIIKAGTGETIDAGDMITIECIGYLDENPPKKFWSTKDPSQKPFTFAVGKRQVIKGWDEGALSMSLHERSRIKIEPKKAYGKFGFEAWGIPPNARIIFEIEVIEHKRMKTR